MTRLSLPERDGMPLDVWVVSYLLPLFLLLTALGGVFYAFDVGETTLEEVLRPLAWSLALGAYFYGRAVVVNHRYLGGDLEAHERRVARANRDQLVLLTGLCAIGAVAIAGYLRWF